MTDEVGKLWTAKLEPMLAIKQAEFTALRDQNRKRGLIGLGAGLGVAILIILIFSPASVVTLILLTAGVGLGVAGWLYKAGGIKDLSSDIKSDVLAKLARQLDLTYTASAQVSGNVDRFHRLGLLPADNLDPAKNRKNFEDHFVAQAAEADFEMFAAKIEQLVDEVTQNEDGPDTVSEVWKILFEGVAIRARFPQSLDGTTVVREFKDLTNQKGLLSKKVFEIAGRTLEPIELIEAKIDGRKYASYGDDQPAVRKLLNPAYMTQLNALKEELDGTGMEMAFAADGDGGEVRLTIPTTGRFEIGTRTNPVPTRESFDRIVRQLSAISELAQSTAPIAAKAEAKPEPKPKAKAKTAAKPKKAPTAKAKSKPKAKPKTKTDG